MAKNLMNKSRKVGDPYLVFEAGDWRWEVLKSWQGDDAKQYARWFTYVTSPMTFGGGDMGDTYVTDVVLNAKLTFADATVFPDGFDADELRRAILGRTMGGKPEPGKQYRLTGSDSIASGATLAEAEVTD